MVVIASGCSVTLTFFNVCMPLTFSSECVGSKHEKWNLDPPMLYLFRRFCRADCIAGVASVIGRCGSFTVIIHPLCSSVCSWLANCSSIKLEKSTLGIDSR